MRITLPEHLEGHGGDVRSGERALENMPRVPDAGRYDLRIEVVDGEEFRDIPHKSDAVLADVVETADERTDIGRPRASGEQCLLGRKNERDVRGNSILGESPYGCGSFRSHRNLDDDIRSKRRQLFPFLDHLVRRGRRHFRADRTVHEPRDRLQKLEEVVLFPRHQTRIGRYAGNDPP